LVYFSLACCTIFIAPSLLMPPRADLSREERLSLQAVSRAVISSYPIFGTGTQSSISTYPSVSPASRLLQPDHNSFTLFLSWFGIFGTLALGSDPLRRSWLSVKKFSQASQYRLENLRIYDLRFLVPLSPLLLLDHYLLTSPQGLFMLLLYLFVVNYPHAQKNRQ